MTSNENSRGPLRQKIETIFQQILESPVYDKALIEDYFSPEYVQHVDGKTLTYAHFLQHVETQKERISQLKISIDAFVEQGNECSSVHWVKAMTQDGRKILVKVIAHFKFHEGKLVSCDELTRLIEGKIEDADVGSCA